MNNCMRDRRVWYGVGALVVLLIFGWAVWLFTKPAPQTSGENAMVTQEQATTTTATTTTSTATSSAPSSTKTTTSKPLSYQQALAAYINRRIQIQSNCQLSPSAPVFKNGTYVMFDNRTPTAQTISLDGARYTIGGYGFKIIRLYASRLPHTIQIDCGSGRNNGRIVLQG